jgi:hypothetical protein
MNRFGLMLVAMAWLMASSCYSKAQTQAGYVFPDCEGLCYFVDLEPLLNLQTRGGDIRSISATELIAEARSGKRVSGGIEIKIWDGLPVPPILDEVVKISVDLGEGRTATCTGVALGRDTILTAGHCTCSPQADYSIFFPHSSPKTESDYFYPPRKLIRAPVRFAGYDCRDRDFAQPGRDLGLLFLEPTALPQQEFDPIPPPAISMMAAYQLAARGRLQNLLVAGYGRTEDDGRFPRGLVAASTRVRDFFCLQDQSSPDGCAIFREFTLANLVSDLSEADTCDGDSGGPVYFVAKRLGPDGKVMLHRMLAGITSRGLSGVPQFGPGQCGGGGVYSAVAHPDVLKWLAVNGVPLELGLGARRFAERGIPAPSDGGAAALQ